MLEAFPPTDDGKASTGWCSSLCFHIPVQKRKENQLREWDFPAESSLCPLASTAPTAPAGMSQDGPGAPPGSSPMHPSGLVPVVLPVGARIALPVLHSEANNNKRRKKGEESFPPGSGESGCSEELP